MSRIKKRYRTGDKGLARLIRELEFHLNEEFIQNELVPRIKASQRG